MAAPQLPKVMTDYYPLAGGLDLESPAISLAPGKCFDAQNYEPNTSGGYRRIDGFERFDGRASPTQASYWLMTVAQTGGIFAGNTIVGATSGAYAKVLGIFNGALILCRLAGAFSLGETLRIGADPVAASLSLADVDAASRPSDHADYKLLAANDQRADILKVPGSGRIRGVWVYRDAVYAFRDNAAGTAGDIHKATPAGWVKVALGQEIQFTAAVGEIKAGDVVVGGTSGASGVVVRALLRSGTWASAGVGTLVLSGVGGTFASGEPLKVSTVTKATSSSLATAISRLPGGQVECVNANFTGSTQTQRMYGADGVNLAFEFDGTNYVPIRTGMASDTPAHVAFHRNYLLLSFLGSVQFSAIGNPYSWSAVLGALEISTGDEVTAMLPQAGNASGASLAIFTKGRTFMLYGTSAANFQLVPSTFDLGYAAGTVQAISNSSFGLTARGIQTLITTQQYGDFSFAAVSFLVQSLLNRKAGMETVATTSKAKNQYRLYFNDGTGLVVGLTGDKVNGIMPVNYGLPVRCICTATLTTGREITLFGSDDGYVYQDGTGTSFDGLPIEAWIRPAFNNLKSPQFRKRFRRAVFEVKSEGFSQVNATYDLGYSSPDVAPAAIQSDLAIVGSGGYWDSFTWDNFTWDTQVNSTPKMSIEGTEKNISFLFYSRRAQDQAHLLTGISLMYSYRRQER